MRPVWFMVPDAPLAWEYPLQWFFGQDLLVAPVVEPGATTWEVFVPPGEWVDAWTGSVVHGGAVVAVDVSRVQRVPVLVRAEAWPQLSACFKQ